MRLEVGEEYVHHRLWCVPMDGMPSLGNLCLGHIRDLGKGRARGAFRDQKVMACKDG